ncbi:hypothetical protein D7B24_000228 [Verticillium nonalfalfae]|uniref:Thioesterase domain-containing protein n=1 Tax=Verticillium nonalfalfae TaxID=1051616 RepID=A0A3M9YHH8_9PEZI|nr:uncharacterized protein D7B24_000228 [Verticillium nonalfalfae]RNJ60033.1 hypothetical protein D7B24_000228 [Verticillium nonalfalfae]
MVHESFDEVMNLIELPGSTSSPTKDPSSPVRYAGLYPAWVLGDEIEGYTPMRQAYGGHVYTQSSLAAVRALEAARKAASPAQPTPDMLGIHSIQGVFAANVISDRPIIYEAKPVFMRRTFSSILVTARQPLEPTPAGESTVFTREDADAPLGDVCFSCLCTFKLPEPASIDSQGTSPHARYAALLRSRPPHTWPHSPQVDLDLVRTYFPGAGPGNFPILDMKKVDMAAINEGKPLQARRELILYRLRAPLPASAPNHHILAHVYESDRNGILMLANHAGLGMALAAGASLTYSYFVHVNPEQAVMKYGAQEDESVWWIQETFFPRVANGRGTLMIKTWSPEGLHVATGYQDGFIKGFKDVNEKL